MTNSRRVNIVSFIKRHWLLEVIVAAIIGMLLSGGWGFVTSIFSNPDQKQEVSRTFEYTSVRPTLIGIYPSDAYGIDQKSGFLASLERYEGDFDIVHLDNLSLNMMKEGKIEPYLDKLRETLDSKNVFAIVGPSVTESSKAIIEVLKNYDNRPPIFLLTAASKKTLEWDKNRKTIPMYRICTDIDLRARKISGLLEKYVEKKKKVGLLVEKNDQSDSYGNQFLETIEIAFGKAKFLNNINKNLIRIETFERKNLEANASKYHSFFQDNDLVLFLGIGNDFKTFLDHHYLVRQNPKALFGGWLSSYAYNSELVNNTYNSSKIFEITDFDITAHSFSSPTENTEYFKTLGRSVAPPERDFALGFDAGYIVSKAYKNLTVNKKDYVLFNDFGIEKFASLINSANGKNVWDGITGEINFALNGENRRDIMYVQYSDGKWNVIDSAKDFPNN